jgi:hypothetical protein
MIMVGPSVGGAGPDPIFGKLDNMEAMRPIEGDDPAHHEV